MLSRKAASTNRARWVGLDVFRAVAILLVLVSHYPDSLGDTLESIYLQIQPFAWAGVDLFFVLSGFLIAHLLFEELALKGRVNVSRFWIRRSFKIYPGFYLLIALSALGVVPLETSRTVGRGVAELLFVQNYFPHFWRHTWSLALEEHFYIAMAILFALPGIAERARRWPALVATIAGACLFLRGITPAPFTYETHLFPTHLRIDSLFIGTLVAWLYHFGGPGVVAFVRENRLKLLVIGFALVRWGFWGSLESSRYVQIFGVFFIATGCALFVALVVFEAFSFVPPRPTSNVLVWIGRTSYATYLWHLPVLRLLELKGSSVFGTGPGFAIYFAGSIILGFLTTQFLESPLLRLRDRLFPRFHDRFKPGPTPSLAA